MKKKKPDQPTWSNLSDVALKAYSGQVKRALTTKPNIWTGPPLNAVITAGANATNPASAGRFQIVDNKLHLDFFDGSTHTIPVEGIWPVQYVEPPHKPAPEPPEDIEPWTPPLTVADTFI